MCFFKSPKQNDIPPPPVQADSSKAVASAADTLAKIKANSNNPNIATSPMGDTSTATIEKQTLLGA